MAQNDGTVENNKNMAVVSNVKLNGKLLFNGREYYFISTNNNSRYMLLNDFSKAQAGLTRQEIEGKIKIELVSFPKNKIGNNSTNVLFCSDEAYFVGLFASLHSVVTNTVNLSLLHFNFIIPIKDSKYFHQLLVKYLEKTGLDMERFNFTIVVMDINVISAGIFNSKCYNGGNHLLNVGNFSRLVIGEIFQYDRLIYLDSDSITQCDLSGKFHSIDMKVPMYSLKLDKPSLTLKISTIISSEFPWREILGKDIDGNSNAFMGAPFVANTKQWRGKLALIEKVMSQHNRTPNGLYKLFTMSLQNIAFYGQIGDLQPFIKCLPDCGSLRKKWTQEQLQGADVLDWSGMLKPWFSNGLHREYWLEYDILNLSKGMGTIGNDKNTVEQFNSQS